jgi:hypothetical protein
MEKPTVIFYISFINAAIWALFIRGLCTLWGWPWFVSLIALVIIFAITFMALCWMAYSEVGRYEPWN